MKRIAPVVVLAASLAVSVVTVATAPGAGPARADSPTWDAVVPGEYLVSLTSDASPADVAAALGVAGIEPLGAGSGVHRVLLDPLADPEATLAVLRNTPGVELAQPNLPLSTTDSLGLRKRFFADLDRPVVVDGAGYTIDQRALGSAGLPAAMTAAGGDGIVVAVLDTGVDLTHPDLVTRLAPDGFDFVDADPVPADDANGRDDDGDGEVDEGVGHGTYVAGLVALVAPGSTILPVRVLGSDGSGTTWSMMQGLAYAAASGARVINLSLGGAWAGDLADRQLEQLEQAGIVVVAAGGNDGIDGSGAQVYPAAAEGVVGVTAIDGSSGAAASFANRGSWLDVAAPGVAITSTFPGGRYASWGGTSASTPVVAGVLALAAAAMPGAQVDDIVDRVTSTSIADGLSGLSAYGRIDAAAALDAARR